MISHDLLPLLEPLERFESIRAHAARLGPRLCDLSYANPYAGIQKSARDAIRAALDDDRVLSFQYSPFGGQTIIRRVIADALRDSHGLPFGYRGVILTPGAMAALQLALRAVGRPGEEVVIPVPCWLDHPLYVRHCGRIPVTVALAPPHFDLDVDAVLAAVSDRTCAVLLTHPSNPTGRNYAPVALEHLAEGLRQAEERWGRAITLIADETHRDFVPVGRYHSAARVHDRTLVVYSFGKYHFMQGQRIGYVAVSPRHDASAEVCVELVRWARITGTATPTAVMQRALPRLLQATYDHSWIDRWRTRLRQNLTTEGYDVVHTDSTLFMYVATPAPYSDFDFVSALAARGVLVLPAPVFHHAGYFRLALTGSEAMLESAVPVLRKLRMP